MTPEYLKESGLLDEGREERQGDDQRADDMRAREDRVPAVRPARRPVALGRVRRQDEARAVQQALVGAALKYQGIAPPVARTERPTSIRARSTTSRRTRRTCATSSRASSSSSSTARCARRPATPGPLHECSIYGNKEAGEAFKKMLALGASQAVAGRAVRADRSARDGCDRDPRVLRAAADVARGAEQGRAVRLVTSMDAYLIPWRRAS